MRYVELTYGDKIITNHKKIDEILKNHKFYWLIDSEIENAKIEIKNNTLVWHSGDFYSGNWIFGIFKEGNFYGDFINGIFEKGNFKGKWHSGINLN